MRLSLIGGGKPIGVFKFIMGEIEENQIPEEEFDETMESLSTKEPDDPTISLSRDYSEARPKPKGASASGSDMGNRLPSGGRSGNPKTDKFQGFRVPPMYQ